MRIVRDVIAVVFFAVLSLHVTSAKWAAEDDGDSTFEMDMMQDALTLADPRQFYRQYGAPDGPSPRQSDQSEPDDLLFSPDYGLSRHKRAIQDTDQPLYSGEGDPCDTDSTLCNNTGQQCAFDTNIEVGYECLCDEDYEVGDDDAIPCVEIPESKKLYLTTTLDLAYDADFGNQTSLAFKEFQSQCQEAFSQEFTGLLGYKTLRVLLFRSVTDKTEVVYALFFTTDVPSTTLNDVADRVITMETEKTVQIGVQQIALVGYTGVFATMDDTDTVSDAVDWCSEERLYKCADDRVCNDGGKDLRYSCVCKKRFVDVGGKCVDENVVQPGLYPYGDRAGDMRMIDTDDGWEMVDITTGIPVNRELQYRAFIATNGVISFGRPKSGLASSLDPKTTMFAIFMTDLVPGAVHYQVYEDRASHGAVFAKADADVRGLVLSNDNPSYRAKLVLVVTWYQVSHYSIRPSERQSRHATFQAVLVSDGDMSYVLVLYESGATRWGAMEDLSILIGVSRGQDQGVELQPVSNTPLAFSMDSSPGNTGRLGTWTHDLGEAYSADMECLDWYRSHRQDRSFYVLISDFLPPCPCSLFGLGRIWVFSRWDGVNLCARLSRGFSRSFRPYSKECCFRMAGRLWGTLVPNVGGLLTANPAFRSLRTRHQEQDRHYHDVCCRRAAPGYCGLYLHLRPLGTCSRRASFGRSVMLGDPHVITLDGKDYTFNGLGEFTMVTVRTENVTFTLQGRTDKALNDNGTAINATVFTAFAASEGDEKVHVELEPVDRQSMIIWVGDKDYTLQFQQTANLLVDELTYTLERVNDSLEVTFPSGISLSISVGFKLLDIGVSLPNSLKGEPKGLMGNFNDDPADDFTLANETVLDTNMTERDIFRLFGSSWAVSDNQSLFRYDPRKGPGDFRHPDFVPIFLDEASPADMAAAETLCGKTNAACIYDYVATGSQAVAQATKVTKDSADETESQLKNNVPEVTGNDFIVVSPGQEVTIQLLGVDEEDGQSVTYLASDTASGNFTLDNTTGIVTYRVTPNQLNDSLEFFVVDSKQAPSPVKAVVVVLCPHCSAPNGQCDPTRPRPALSSQTYTYARCACAPWWDGDDCERDLDACAEDPCIPGQDCTDLPPAEHEARRVGYNCSACPAGYAAIDGKCADVDECNSSTTAAAADNECQHVCVNTEGSYLCSCHAGYRLGQGGRACEDINECVEKTSDCGQLCSNAVGGYNCSCEAGYVLNATDNSCAQEAATLVTCATANCSQGCRVAVNTSTPECFCFPGYVVGAGDNTTCEDDDECDAGICSQDCSNSVGSFACSCYVGFRLDADGTTCVACRSLTYGAGCGEVCECNGRSTGCDPVTGCVCRSGWRGAGCQLDVDECQENPGVCGQGLQTCRNTLGSYRCDCLHGYARAPDNAECADVNECAGNSTLNTCADLEDCQNTVGSFHCVCSPGYQRDSDNNCTDSNECESGAAQCQQICNNNVGSFACSCQLGFRLAADRRACEKAEDVCAAALNCSFECTLDDNDQPYCFCETGYNLGSDLQTCIDIDECEDETEVRCSHTCSNLPGTFRCACPVGMRLGNDQRTCITCEAGTYGRDCGSPCGCGLGAVGCDPATGCLCLSGWTGERCDRDIDECNTLDAANQCSAQNARCDNFPGGWRCVCAPGYEKDNGTNVCEDVDECDSSPCSQRCENNPGSFLCLCNAGFTLNTTTRQCQDNDECSLSSTNRCTQKCVNTLGSYRCTCDRPGFTLDNNGYVCKANTECGNPGACAASGNGGCMVNATSGSDTCYCNNGFELDGSDDCVLEERDWCGEAGCQQNCTNTTIVPYFRCGCDDGYQLNDDALTCRVCPAGQWGPACGQQCNCSELTTRECVKENGTCLCADGWEGDDCGQDVDECDFPALFPCVDNSQCQNTDGSHLCVCLKGFTAGSDGNCTECDEGFYDDCSKRCECVTLNTLSCNKENGTCTCHTGWRGGNCSQDVDECTDGDLPHNCTGSHENCRNNDGGFHCVCQRGYQRNASGVCVDRDECFDNSHNCSQRCVNTDGGFTCSCQPGYHGDVYNCTECPDGKYGADCADSCNCVHSSPDSCDKVSGACACRPGWTGQLCDSDIAECAAHTDPCPVHSTCADTDGSFTCTCNTGYGQRPDGNCTGVKTVAFELTLDIVITDLSSVLSDKQSDQYLGLEKEVKDKLFEELKKTVPSLLEIIILFLRQGSLVVGAEGQLDTTADPEKDVVSAMAKAVVALTDTNFTIGGQTGAVTGLLVNNQSVADACDVYEASIPCESDAYCRVNVTSGLPSCLPLVEEDVSDYKLVIGLGVGIPLFLIALGAIAFIVYTHVQSRRREKYGQWPVDDDQLSAVLSRKIATRGGLWNPARDQYSCDSLSSAASDDDQQRGRLRGAQRSDYDTSPWNNRARQPAAEANGRSNFSWDFLYNQLPPPDQPFVLKRPKIASSANPTYDNGRSDTRTGQL